MESDDSESVYEDCDSSDELCERIDISQFPHFEEGNDLKFNDLEFVANLVGDSSLTVPMQREVLVTPTSNSHNEMDDVPNDDEVEATLDRNKSIEDIDSSSTEGSDDDYEEKRKISGLKSEPQMWLTEEEESVPVGPPRTKNEIEAEIPSLDDVILKPDDKFQPVGEVLYRIDHENTIIVQAVSTTTVLNEGSVLCLADGSILGRVHEVFGPITEPFYIVKWNPRSGSKMEAAGSTTGIMGKGRQSCEQVSQELENNERMSCDNRIEPEIITALVNVASDEAVMESSDSVDVADKNVAADQNVRLENSDNTSTEVEGTAEGPKQVSESVAITVQATTRLATPSTVMPGTPVYSLAAYSSYVTASSLLQQRSKGSDASNLYDEEVTIYLHID